jgi:hypothetical protein
MKPDLAAKSIRTRFGTIICYFSCKIVIFQPAQVAPHSPDATQCNQQNKEVGGTR